MLISEDNESNYNYAKTSLKEAVQVEIYRAVLICLKKDSESYSFSIVIHSDS